MDDFMFDNVGALKAAKESSNIAKLKDLGSDFAEQAFVRQDPRLIEYGVIAYSLAKFLEKPYIVGAPKWADFSEEIGDQLVQAQEALKREDPAAFEEATGRMTHKILELSATMGRFVSSVADKARIKAAAQMYAHGASLGAAAKLAGADKRELSKYIGTTRIPEKYATLPVRQRLAAIEKYF